MNRMFVATVLASLVSIGMAGCSEATNPTKSSTKQETTISTPGGTTTITTERDIKKTGDKPPATTY